MKRKENHKEKLLDHLDNIRQTIIEAAYVENFNINLVKEFRTIIDHDSPFQKRIPTGYIDTDIDNRLKRSQLETKKINTKSN